MAEKKLFAGPKIRRLRKGLGLTQTQMAEELGVSASYLNLIERDQRPVSARILLQLAETFDLDLRGFGADADAAVLAALRDVAADPLLSAFEIDAAELRELAERQPRIADALARLHGGYREALAGAAELLERQAGRDEPGALLGDAPADEVRDVLHDRNNHFPTLETAAERLAEELDARDGQIFASLARRLLERHAVTVKILPYDVMAGSLRRFDRHSRRVLLSEMLAPSARIFQLAYQLALFEAGEEIDRLAAEPQLSSEEARGLLRIGLASYIAGALMMPYERFRAAAAETRHDIDVLAQRFSASIEQVCHRLTTLRRPGARGVPFFMIRVDQAGNVTKRFGGRVFPFSRFGGACPRWDVYDAFREPDAWVRQLVELPDGARFLTIAHAVRRPLAAPHEPGQLLAIGLGCEVEHAPALIYSRGLDLKGEDAFTPIGINCRVCERAQCPRRAHPPLRRRIYVDENRRSIAAFSFRAD
jgi:predicted transcriptional regulator/DNA-binding XRE family transcriptional regulator